MKNHTSCRFLKEENEKSQKFMIFGSFSTATAAKSMGFCSQQNVW
jgi:hypothetical protein